MKHEPFGLVLGGGGARGMAHVGALRALEHYGFTPSAIVGVSMGAVIGATYALNDNWYRDLVGMDTSGFPTLPKFSTPGVRAMLKNLLVAEHALQDLYFGLGAGEDSVGWGRGVLKHLTQDKNLEDGRIPVYATATDILTGERVVKHTGNAVDAVYASSALAGLLPPHEDGPHLLIDGGYSDKAPLDVLRELGLWRIIAIDPGQEYISSYPKNGLEVMLRSVEITQNVCAKMQFAKADCLIKPQFDERIGAMDFARKRDCIAAGATAVRRSLTDIQTLLLPVIEPESSDLKTSRKKLRLFR